MTHLYIKICDLCTKACEAGSQNHAGNIRTDILISKNKVSISVLREEFDICIECLNKTGLYGILKQMSETKKNNKNTATNTEKLIAKKTKQIK